jgi:hypothetical protein
MKYLLIIVCAVLIAGCNEESEDFMSYERTDKPIINIVSPEEMSTVNSDFTLVIQFNNFFQCREISVSINSSEARYDYSSPFSLIVYTNKLRQGINEIKVKTWDVQGNTFLTTRYFEYFAKR